jgi:hypothetical protein
MSDGYVQVQADSIGKKVDTSEVTRSDGTVAERQRTVGADPCDTSAQGLAAVRGGKLQVSDEHAQLLESINEKLGRMLFILENAVNQ